MLPINRFLVFLQRLIKLQFISDYDQ